MNWIAYPGTKEFAEYHESEAGRVESMGPGAVLIVRCRFPQATGIRE